MWHLINRDGKEIVMLIELGKASIETKGQAPGIASDPVPLVFPKIYTSSFVVD